MKDPTQRQMIVLRIVSDYAAKHGYSPSIREVRDELGVGNLRGATVHLDALERKGFITRCRPATARSIRITPTGFQALGEIEMPAGAVGRIVQLMYDERDRQLNAVRNIDPSLTAAIKRIRYTAGIINALAHRIAKDFKEPPL